MISEPPKSSHLKILALDFCPVKVTQYGNELSERIMKDAFHFDTQVWKLEWWH